MTAQIGVAVIMAALAELALHWLPWHLLLGRELPRPAAYTLGTLGIALPLTGLFVTWKLGEAVMALWAVVIGAGLAVVGAYLFDAWLHARQASKECAEREQALLEEIADGSTNEPR